MATTIKWTDNNVIETAHRIYKSSTYFDKDSLPAVLVELGPDVTEWVDPDGVDGENWYIVSALLNDYEVFSEPFIVGLTTVFTHDVFGDGSAVATYNFDGDATDLGGTYNGTWIGSENYENGLMGGSAAIQSSGNGIQTPSMTFSSISLWWKKDAFERDRFLIEYNNGGRIYINNDFTLDGTFQNTRLDGVPYSNKDPVPLDGNWHHFYLETPNKTANIRLGLEYGTLPRSLGGGIDQVRIFNRALTQQEVDILYQEKEQHFYEWN